MERCCGGIKKIRKSSPGQKKLERSVIDTGYSTSVSESISVVDTYSQRAEFESSQQHSSNITHPVASTDDSNTCTSNTKDAVHVFTEQPVRKNSEKNFAHEDNNATTLNRKQGGL